MRYWARKFLEDLQAGRARADIEARLPFMLEPIRAGAEEALAQWEEDAFWLGSDAGLDYLDDVNTIDVEE